MSNKSSLIQKINAAIAALLADVDRLKQKHNV